MSTRPSIYRPTLFLFGSLMLFLFLVIPKYSNADINTGLIGWWKLDETSGTTASDSSGSGNDGTLFNDPVWTNGKIANSLLFNGTSQSVNLGSINLANSSFTISAWANRAPGSTLWNLILGQGQNVLDLGLHFGFRPSNVFTFAFAGDDLNTVAHYTDSGWHFWTGTFNATTKARAIYRDGVRIVFDTASGKYHGSGAINIANWDIGNYWFNGLIDDVRIYSRALSSSDVNELYISLGAGPSGSLCRYVPQWQYRYEYQSPYPYPYPYEYEYEYQTPYGYEYQYETPAYSYEYQNPYPYEYQTPYAYEYQTPYSYQSPYPYEYQYEYESPYTYPYEYEYQYQTPRPTEF